MELGWNKWDLNKPNRYSDSLFDIFCYSGYLDVIEYVGSLGYEPSQEKLTWLIKQINNIITGECDDYWSGDEVDEDFLLETLDKVLNLLESKVVK